MITVKANEQDYKKYSDAIDKIQEGNDAMIDLFNELEDDVSFIEFDEDVIKTIEAAKEKYGGKVIDKKINTFIREMLSLLDLEEES